MPPPPTLPPATILDTDQRDQRLTDDDDTGVFGGQLDDWMKARRSGEVIAGVANCPDSNTLRGKVFADPRYTSRGVSVWYHLESLQKDLDASDDRLEQRTLNIICSLAMVSPHFDP